MNLSKLQGKLMAAARKNRFVPGKGGNANPSKPLMQKGNESPAEVADLLWEQLQASDT